MVFELVWPPFWPLPRRVRVASVMGVTAIEDLVAGVAARDDVVDVMQTAVRLATQAAAASLTAILAVADTGQDGFGADEVAFALAWTQGQARSQVEFGRYLTRTLPDVWAGFAAGDIDTRKAWTFCDVLATIDDDIAAQIAGRFIGDAPDWTYVQLRDRLRRAVLKADPDRAKDRHRRNLNNRRIGSTLDDDGTASLYGIFLPAARVAAAWDRINSYAKALRHAGDQRTLDQLRADTFLDLLEGVHPDTPPVHRVGVIELTVPWDTATGAADTPATLAGYGPICADIARQLLTSPAAQTAQWRYSVTGTHGELIAHGLTIRPVPPVETDPSRRFPGAALGRWIRARDRTCRAPGCHRPARDTDIDHTRDHARGGPTAHDNLAALCHHHHLLKDAGWKVCQPTPGRIE